MARPEFTPIAWLCLLVCAQVVVAQPTTKPAAAEPARLSPRLRALPFHHIGPFVELADGRVLCVTDDAAHVSGDDGRTWESRPIFGERKMKVRPEQALVRTKAGTIVLVFLD